jgi:2-methylcitrate dehydratase PrpD
VNPPTRTPSEPLAQRLASQALATRLEDFDSNVIEKAKLCLFDYIACALESRTLPWSLQALASITETPSGAALMGRGARAAPADAAFVNAVAGHGLVREDMHVGAVAHLGVVVWPSLLSHAFRAPIDGARFLTAAIVGYEVGARLGRAIVTPELTRLFRPTGLVGAPAAALALAYFSGLEREKAQNGFALAVNTVAGLNQWPHSGGSEMYFHPGFAARNAITAHDLARAGAIASPRIIEGEAGLFAAYARRKYDGVLDLFPAGEVELLAVFNKEVPACNFAQTPCQAALRAIPRIGASSEIVKIELRVTEAAARYPGCDSKGPFGNALQAKMSIFFGVAATLARGVITEANYARLDDPEIGRLITATTMVIDPVLTAAFPARQGAVLRVVSADGSIVESALDDVLPAPPQLIRSRFDQQASETWGTAGAEAVAALITNLENESDIRRLDKLFAGPIGSARMHGDISSLMNKRQSGKGKL